MNPDPILPVVLTVTVYPPKKNKRMVVVSGAPEGEMPLVLTGLFQERHALLDQAYAQCMKRKPQLVTLKGDKSSKPDKAKSITGGVEDDDEETSVTESDATDQLVTDAEVSEPKNAESVPVSPITESELPLIEGDTTSISAEQAAAFAQQITATDDVLDRNEHLDLMAVETDDDRRQQEIHRWGD